MEVLLFNYKNFKHNEVNGNFIYKLNTNDILHEMARVYFYKKWFELFRYYFKDKQRYGLDRAIDIYLNIPDLEVGNDKIIAEFTYYLMEIEIIDKCNFIDNFYMVESQLRPLIKQQKENQEFQLFKKQLKDVAEKNIRYSVDDTDLMDGYEFEEFLEELLLAMGYSMERTKLSGDQGIDLIANRLGKRIGIQAKCYSSKVGNKAIQEVVAGMKVYECTKGVVVTNNYFTEPAKDLAKINGILLWDRSSLQEKIERYLN